MLYLLMAFFQTVPVLFTPSFLYLCLISIAPLELKSSVWTSCLVKQYLIKGVGTKKKRNKRQDRIRGGGLLVNTVETSNLFLLVLSTQGKKEGQKTSLS